jgi:nitronate monooxygenase
MTDVPSLVLSTRSLSQERVDKNSGTGVGLINKVQPAGEIVREVREEAKREIQRAAGLV